MKRFMAVLLALLLVLSMTACGRSSQQPEPTPTSEIAQPTPEPTPVVDEPQSDALGVLADLVGVWLQIGSEVDGDVSDTLPYRFNSLIFRLDGEQTLLASSEYGGYGEMIDFGEYDLETTLLDEPLYSGCGNEEWSVRIGDESAKDEHGFPTEPETYVTLLDKNTLLMQTFFTIDGGPGVNYQTYKRFLSEAETELLSGGSFRLTGYIGADGIRRDKHPDGYNEFNLHLAENGSYAFNIKDASGNNLHRGGGAFWVRGDGGTILLVGNDCEQERYAGAVQYYNESWQIFLWDNIGGILCLEQLPPDDTEWAGYVDTMSDIEGNAFAAPANTLFVIYNKDYGLLQDFYWLRSYELSDEPDAQYLLISAVEDGTYFWLEDQDGYCAEDFGTLDAGESIIIRMDIPVSDGLKLQVSTSLGDYFYELTQDNLVFEETWNYITN